jgi:hypothetical protein
MHFSRPEEWIATCRNTPMFGFDLFFLHLSLAPRLLRAYPLDPAPGLACARPDSGSSPVDRTQAGEGSME